ncbi:MAG: thioredoxin [Candidatus Gracilibacteria bacterium]|jgi:thioredoxin 1
MAHVLTSSDFDSTIASGVTLVDFYADWCGPCQRLIPIIDDLAKMYEGRANICKLDVDVSGSIAQRYGIMSIPTVLLFKEGQLVEKVVGLQSEGDLVSLVDKHLV